MNRSKFLIRGLVLGVLLCVVGIVAWYRKSTGCFYPARSPMHSFVLTIDPNQQRALIEQSEKFADNRGFKFDIVYYTPQGDNFLIDMKRKDIEVIISNTMLRLDEFDVSFYNNDCIHPTMVSGTVDLASDLRSVIHEIPSVKFTEDK